MPSPHYQKKMKQEIIAFGLVIFVLLSCTGIPTIICWTICDEKFGGWGLLMMIAISCLLTIWATYPRGIKR